MTAFSEPTKWAQTLGKDADVVTIPDTAGDTDPSIDKIFPSVFSVPLANGGRAIPRSVLNGLFKLVGDSVYYMQNGGQWSYNSTFDYAVGRVVLYTDGNLYKCIQANGASTEVKAPTETAYWSKITTLADVAGAFANQDLSNLSADGQALFNNKANVDFSNVSAPTQTFKNMVIDWDSPDFYRRIALSLTSGDVYTPPCDGYIIGHFSYGLNTGAEFSVFYGQTLYLDGFSQGISSSPMYGTINFRVNKGQGYSFLNTGVSFFDLSFYPCKGAN